MEIVVVRVSTNSPRLPPSMEKSEKCTQVQKRVREHIRRPSHRNAEASVGCCTARTYVRGINATEIYVATARMKFHSGRCAHKCRRAGSAGGGRVMVPSTDIHYKPDPSPLLPLILSLSRYIPYLSPSFLLSLILSLSRSLRSAMPRLIKYVLRV